MQGNIWDNQNLVDVIKRGGVCVIPTDTIYGIVTSALSESSVSRIYDLRKRNKDKPCIILIEDLGDLKNFSITINENQKNKLLEFWEEENERPTSIVFECLDEHFKYLHRGTNTLAFRLPKKKGLRNLIKETGPLIAPSANIEGEPFSRNINDARGYFGDKVDLYIDGGSIEGAPSVVIKLHKDGSHNILRA